MTEFEVINRFVDVDGTNKMAHILEVMFFVDVDGTLFDFMRTILVYLFCALWFVGGLSSKNKFLTVRFPILKNQNNHIVYNQETF